MVVVPHPRVLYLVRKGGENVDKVNLKLRLDAAVENFRRDMALFEGGTDKPASAADVKALSEMTFYAISDIAKIISEELD